MIESKNKPKDRDSLQEGIGDGKGPHITNNLRLPQQHSIHSNPLPSARHPRKPHHKNPPPLPQALQTPIHQPHRIKYHIDTPPLSELENGIDPIGRAVVDTFIGAELPRYGEFAERGRGSDDARAGCFGDLDGGETEAAGGGVDEYCFVALETPAED